MSLKKLCKAYHNSVFSTDVVKGLLIWAVLIGIFIWVYHRGGL